MAAKLPQGPRIMVELRFTPRELELIELRYGKCLSEKEIAAAWGVTKRIVGFHNSNVGLKLGINGLGSCSAFHIIATKRLIKLGFIMAE